mmetsp:Transcript_3015/g.5445  ORF Transcript_3015/g.5445 Transcript_3015/m.5445 type:complete len:216 (+) Transcript_3015:1459-2106(+)
MVHSRDLAPHAVVQPPCRVVVNKAVPDPQPRAHALIDLAQQLKGIVNAVLVDLATALIERLHNLPIELKDVKGGICGEADQLPAIRPVHLLHRHIDTTDDVALRPIIEADEVRGAHRQQGPTVDALRHKRWTNGLGLLEVLEDLDTGRGLPARKLVRVRAPDAFESLPKRLVPPRQRRVDDVLAITSDDHKAAVGVVHQSLWVKVTGTEVLDRER